MRTNWKILFEKFIVTYLGRKFRDWLVSRTWLWNVEKDGVWIVHSHILFDLLHISQEDELNYYINSILDNTITIKKKNKLIIYYGRSR